MKHDRPKISDVARMAGVSTATVSRTLSNPGLVSEETRAAVQAAVEATGYRPNLAARNLRHRRTGGIVALVPNLANPFFSQILSGIASVLGPAGYNLLIADTRAAGAETLLDYAEPSRADGLIILDGTLPADALQGRVPVVEACEWVPGLPAPRVKIDNRAAAGMAINHLADLGHRRIGLVNGLEFMDFAIRRRSGYEDALGAAGIAVDPSILASDEMTETAGFRAMQTMLALPVPPSAIVVSSMLMALGVRRAIEKNGLKLGRDISVITHDDELSYLRNGDDVPIFTATRSSVREAGRQAADMLLSIISGKAAGPIERLLEAELIIGQSTGPFKG